MEKQKFYQVYQGLPINIRNEIILVLDDEGPITWKIAYLEIENGTKLGETIFKKLEELEFI